MLIEVEVTPNPATMRFLVPSLLPIHEPIAFGGDAGPRPRIADRLLRVTGVRDVLLAPEFVAVSREPSAPDWSDLRFDVVMALTEALEAGDGAGLELWVEKDVLRTATTRDPVEEQIVDILRTRIAPAVGRDGGSITLVGYRDGVATGINAPTSKVETLEALALAHDRAGETVASCAFRIAAADARADAIGAKAASTVDATRLARAVACERTNGHAASADRWLAGRIDRDAIEAATTKVGSSVQENASFGDIVASAKWDGNADLDIAIVDPAGNRYAWDTKASGVRVVDATSRSHEQLAISRWAAGTFSVEVVRSVGSTAPINGQLEVKALGETTTVPFTLTGVRQRVARVDVSLQSELVPVTSGTASFDRDVATSRLKNVNVAVCAQNGGPNGNGSASVTFDPSGTVSNVFVTTPFSGTSVGACIMGQLARIHTEPFSGGPVMVRRQFVIPP